MLTLMLLRHAKAVQQAEGDDFSRELTEKGMADAARLGAFLVRKNCVPDLAMVSAAARTMQTYANLKTADDRTIPARFGQGLYNASATRLRDVLRRVDPAVVRLMIIGHNPGIMDVAVALARDGDLAEIIRMRDRFPPCGLAVLTFDTEDWLDARASGGRLDLFVTPEDLVSSR